MVETGFGLLFDVLGLFEIFGPTSSLPKDVQQEHRRNLLKTDFYQTVIDEGRNWGESCSSVFNQTSVDYPLIVLIAAIYEVDLSAGLDQVNLSATGRGVVIP